MPEEIEIPDKLVEEVTREFLKKMSSPSRGAKIAFMNATIQGQYKQLQGLSPEGITSLNILQRIGRDVSRKMGLNPNGSVQEREKYNSIKMNARLKISSFIHKDAKVNAQFEKLIAKKRFQNSAKIGKSKLGRFIAKTSSWARKRRNL